MQTIHSFRCQVRQLLDQNFLALFQTELPHALLDKLVKRFAPNSRERLWTIANTTKLWILAALQPEKSFAAVLTRFWGPIVQSLPDLAAFKPSTARFSEARSRVPLELLKEVRKQLSHQVALEDPGWFGSHIKRLLWIDGSGFSMPNTRELADYFGRSKNQNRESLNPQGRIVNMGLVNSRALVASAYGPYNTSEVALTREFLRDSLNPGDLLLGDSLYATAEFMALARDCGANMLCAKHSSVTVHGKKQITEKIGPDDWRIQFRMRPEIYASDELLPKFVSMRVCKVKVKKKAKTSYLWLQTTLLDPEEFPKERLAELFSERWDAETSYEELKVTLHMGVLRSKSVEGVWKEIEAHLVAYNFVRLELQRAGKLKGLRGKDLSYTEGLRTIREVGRLIWDKSEREITRLLEICRTQLAATVIKKRPGRMEPRAVRRGRVKYPKLRQSREKWRLENGWSP